MRKSGLLLIAGVLALPIVWFVDLFGRQDEIAVFSQFLGVQALLLMSVSQLLATRLAVLERAFGGLDRMYVLHKWLGVAALGCVLAHDTIDAEMDGLGRGGFLEGLAETLGEISLYGLLILATITIATFVPYRLWRRTHRFIGAFFVCAAAHFLLIAKPFAVTDPVGLYVSAFCAVGAASYLYAFARNASLRGAVDYGVSTVEPTGDAVAVTLAPTGRPVRAKPGQFAFLRFALPGLDDPHPFTLSRAPHADGHIRVTFKPLGDDTRRLATRIAPGTAVRATNGYGRFLAPEAGRGQIWIVAGIGVTPFIAWLEAGHARRGPGAIDVFYCVSGPAPHLTLFEKVASENPDFRLHLRRSDRDGRLTAAMVAAAARTPVDEADVYFCGPAEMRRTLFEGLVALGLPKRRFHFEAFELRSGLGLRRLATWAFNRFY